MSSKKTKELKSPIKKYNDQMSEDQALAKKVMANHIITCVRGNAGTGKTHLGITYALEKMAKERRHGGVEGVTVTRPIVFEKGKNMGFLPGDLWDKIDPWIKPISEIVIGIEGGEGYESMVKDGIFDIAPLMVIQGRTFSRRVILIDEAQNLTHQDVEDLFTRIGRGSQMIFMGDMRQCKLPSYGLSGFPALCALTSKSSNVGDCELTTNFRSEIVEELLKIYHV